MLSLFNNFGNTFENYFMVNSTGVQEEDEALLDDYMQMVYEGISESLNYVFSKKPDMENASFLVFGWIKTPGSQKTEPDAIGGKILQDKDVLADFISDTIGDAEWFDIYIDGGNFNIDAYVEQSLFTCKVRAITSFGVNYLENIEKSQFSREAVHKYLRTSQTLTCPLV